MELDPKIIMLNCLSQHVDSNINIYYFIKKSNV